MTKRHAKKNNTPPASPAVPPGMVAVTEYHEEIAVVRGTRVRRQVPVVTFVPRAAAPAPTPAPPTSTTSADQQVGGKMPAGATFVNYKDPLNAKYAHYKGRIRRGDFKTPSAIPHLNSPILRRSKAAGTITGTKTKAAASKAAVSRDIPASLPFQNRVQQPGSAPVRRRSSGRTCLTCGGPALADTPYCYTHKEE